MVEFCWVGARHLPSSAALCMHTAHVRCLVPSQKPHAPSTTVPQTTHHLQDCPLAARRLPRPPVRILPPCRCQLGQRALGYRRAAAAAQPAVSWQEPLLGLDRSRWLQAAVCRPAERLDDARSHAAAAPPGHAAAWACPAACLCPWAAHRRLHRRSSAAWSVRRWRPRARCRHRCPRRRRAHRCRLWRRGSAGPRGHQSAPWPGRALRCALGISRAVGLGQGGPGVSWAYRSDSTMNPCASHHHMSFFATAARSTMHTHRRACKWTGPRPALSAPLPPSSPPAPPSRGGAAGATSCW